MKKKIFVMMIFVMIAGCKKENPITPEQEAQIYFPLAKGNTWTYVESVNDTANDTPVLFTVRLDTPEIRNRLRWYGANNNCDKIRIASYLPLECAQWAIDNNRVLSVYPVGLRGEYPEPQVILDFPLLKGKQWIIKFSDTTYNYGEIVIHEVRYSKRAVVGIETLSTPAGQFESCIHILDSTTLSISTSFLPDSSFHCETTDEWYAQAVGLVNRVMDVQQIGGIPYHHTLRMQLISYDIKTSD